MCKIWGCKVDDPIFEDINSAQWAWYAHMIAKDEKESADLNIEFIEYLASFWNAEAVKKIKDSRADTTKQGFASDEEFEEQILSNSFKEDDIVKAIKEKYKNTNLDNNNMNSKERTRRLPKDLSGIREMFGGDD